MIYVTQEQFVKDTVELNPSMKGQEEELKAALDMTLQAHKDGERCTICGEPLWVAGSALIGNRMCFTCIMGSTDDDGYYEIYGA